MNKGLGYAVFVIIALIVAPRPVNAMHSTLEMGCYGYTLDCLRAQEECKISLFICLNDESGAFGDITEICRRAGAACNMAKKCVTGPGYMCLLEPASRDAVQDIDNILDGGSQN